MPQEGISRIKTQLTTNTYTPMKRTSRRTYLSGDAATLLSAHARTSLTATGNNSTNRSATTRQLRKGSARSRQGQSTTPANSATPRQHHTEIAELSAMGQSRRGPLLEIGFRGECGMGAAPAGWSCAPRRHGGPADLVWRLRAPDRLKRSARADGTRPYARPRRAGWIVSVSRAGPKRSGRGTRGTRGRHRSLSRPGRPGYAAGAWVARPVRAPPRPSARR
jgi:hypothetical protein